MGELTEAHKARLQAAVDEVNAAMDQIRADCGNTVLIYPRTRYNEFEGTSGIEIELTTGRVLICRTEALL